MKGLYKIVAIAFFLFGALFLTIGILASQSYLEWIFQKIAGRYTQKTMCYLLVGSSFLMISFLFYLHRIFSKLKSSGFSKML